MTPSVETLRALHRAHVLTVPFENLDIHRRRPISLDLSDLFRKIVLSRRGGYCFELNGFFALLLEQLGFASRNWLPGIVWDGERKAAEAPGVAASSGRGALDCRCRIRRAGTT